MHHIICKTLLLLSIILAIVAVSTPDWEVGTAKNKKGTTNINVGLFKICNSSNLSTSGNKSSCNSLPDNGSRNNEARKSCQGLAISAIVFLTLALACDFIPQNEFEQGRLVGMGAFAIGIVLMIACIALYANQVYRNIKVDSDGLSVKTGYGYSFYLAITSLVLATGAGIAGVMSPHKLVK